MRVDNNNYQYMRFECGLKHYDSKYFQIEIQLSKGQKVTFYIDGASYGPHYFEHSFLEGKLIR